MSEQPNPLSEPESFDPCSCHQFGDARILHDGHDARCIWSVRAVALSHDYDDDPDSDRVPRERTY